MPVHVHTCAFLQPIRTQISCTAYKEIHVFCSVDSVIRFISTRSTLVCTSATMLLPDHYSHEDEAYEGRTFVYSLFWQHQFLRPTYTSYCKYCKIKKSAARKCNGQRRMTDFINKQQCFEKRPLDKNVHR